ncbi:MAG: ferritin-like domain-containing protein [Acidobacteriota bacterium]|nr:ferritin-like domain-containing protein [Acidobacteriota bacterium]
MEKSLIQNAIEQSPNRRSFVRKLGIAGAAMGAALTVDLKDAKAATSTEVAVLNFALNLEYLEAEFYTVATTGKTLQQTPGFDVGPNPGMTMGGGKVSFPNSLVFTSQVANEIAADERAHVTLLRYLLGGAAVDKPVINLNGLGFGFANESDFLKLARIFEDIGVSAYAGAAKLLTTPTVLDYAARILAAEAEHVANIRLQVARLNVPSIKLDSVDILPPPTGQKFFSLDNNGLAATRTPGQVLYLAFGAGGVSSGGFFPDGVNGTFKTSDKSPA